eukprot:jgi/Tetstr1/457206/TSEL_043854.t1
MRLPLGTAITVRFGDLTDAAKKVWVAAHPGEPVAGVTLRGVVCGHSGAWHRVTFAKDHPEIEREVSLNAAALVPPAPAAAPAEHRRVGPTTFDLEEVQAANQQLLDAFADADAEPAGLPGGLLAMTLHSTVSLEELWDNHAVPSIKALPTRYGFAALMTQRRFNEWRAYFRFWGDPGDLPDSQYSETCQDWVEALNDYCDAITPPVERLKSKYKDGRVHKYRYEVEQRESHATYWQHFNAVDINNKLSVGPHSVATGWGPHSAVLRFWLYTVAVAESNAYLCYTSFTNNKDMTRHEWKPIVVLHVRDSLNLGRECPVGGGRCFQRLALAEAVLNAHQAGEELFRRILFDISVVYAYKGRDGARGSPPRLGHDGRQGRSDDMVFVISVRVRRRKPCL